MLTYGPMTNDFKVGKFIIHIIPHEGGSPGFKGNQHSLGD